MTRKQWGMIILLAEQNCKRVDHYEAVAALKQYIQQPKIWPNGDGTWRPCEK